MDSAYSKGINMRICRMSPAELNQEQRIAVVKQELES